MAGQIFTLWWVVGQTKLSSEEGEWLRVKVVPNAGAVVAGQRKFSSEEGVVLG